MSTLTRISLLGVVALTMGLAPALAAADDVQVKSTPAVIQSGPGQTADVTVQPVRWGFGIGGGRWGRPGFGVYVGPRYYGGGYYGGYYGPRYYGGYGYPRFYPYTGYYHYAPYGYYY